MSELYSTIPKLELEKIISVARSRKLGPDGARWLESGGKDPERENGQSASAS